MATVQKVVVQETGRGKPPCEDKAVIPRHVAIIMDGNGRWATARGLSRTEGHRRGVEVVRNVVRYAGEAGIKYLTLFSFSSENWSRPATEVADLLGLLKLFIRRDLEKLHKNGVRVKVIGRREQLTPDIRDHLEQAEIRTSANRAMTLVVAFNYGARDEITDAVRAIAKQVLRGEMAPEDIEPSVIADHLDTRDIPDPDLIIRTSGEQRLSNFLLWQGAYSELVFVPVLWPDFSKDHFLSAVDEYQKRDRRFGGLTAVQGAG